MPIDELTPFDYSEEVEPGDYFSQRIRGSESLPCDVQQLRAVDGQYQGCVLHQSCGWYTINSYKFEQVENERPLTAADFVTREQFDGLNNKLDFLIQKLGVLNNGEQHTQPNAATRNAK